ncbi:VWA domain-containing protein [Plesiocystis pacifica]|uniref:VWA domain-containing protein n=1 Tax=Plesiocystis pacifica TaxID=191768 RepID=UPI0022B6BF11|nr:VWA domain-containing protein [Plesiocystis pacifica]
MLDKERPEPLTFAGLRFLEAADPVVSQRRTLRERGLLALRLLLLAVVVAVLARPALRSETAVAVLAEPHDAVVILDASASMELRDADGVSVGERALERLDTLLDSLPPGSRVGLCTNDPRGPQVELQPVAEGAGAIRGALDAWGEGGPRRGAWTLAEALARASAMLDEDRGLPRVVYALGDETARGLGSLPPVVGGAITVIPVPVDASAGGAHVGIAELSWEPAPELDPRAVRVRALIQSHQSGPGSGSESGSGSGSGSGSDADAELEIGAALEIDGEVVATTRVLLPPGDRVLAEFNHVLADADEGAARARVRLLDREEDALRIDDRRHLWLSASEVVDVMVVNGDPSETRVNDEIFFLATALGQSELGERVEVRALAPEQLEGRLREEGAAALASVDLLILANVRAPPAELAPLLVGAVDAGMGLWITAGDRVSAADYNARLEPVLPLLLREAVYAGTAPGRTEARSEALAPVELSHPIFQGSAGEAGPGGDLDLGATRTRRMFLLEPDADSGADIAVAFSSGAPALISAEHGRGRVALLTTSIDRDWGDLPLRPGFVPLVTRTVQWLAGSQGAGGAEQVAVGAAKVLGESAPYVVTTPEGRSVPVAPKPGEPAVFEDTDLPGHYLARLRASEGAAGSAGSAPTGEAVERFVVVVDPRESDTSVVEVAEAPALAEGEQTRVTIHEPRWRELALVMLLLLGLESALRMRRLR